MPPTDTGNPTLVERLRAATELLESIAADRSVLAGVPVEDRKRLLRAMALIRNPASRTRRRLEKAAARAQKASRVNRSDPQLGLGVHRNLLRVFPFRFFQSHHKGCTLSLAFEWRVCEVFLKCAGCSLRIAGGE